MQNGDVATLLLRRNVKATAFEFGLHARKRTVFDLAYPMDRIVEWPVDEKLWWRIGRTLLPQIRE